MNHLICAGILLALASSPAAAQGRGGGAGGADGSGATEASSGRETVARVEQRAPTGAVIEHRSGRAAAGRQAAVVHHRRAIAQRSGAGAPGAASEDAPLTTGGGR